MLPHFIHLSLSTGYVLAGLFTCPPASVPHITVKFRNEAPVINHSRSSASLAHLKKDSLSPTYGNAFPILDGVTNGHVQMKYDLEFRGTQEARSRQSCIAARTVHIVITYRPTVYISSDIPKRTCHYKATLNHEIKHVRTDIDTINEYITDIKDAAEQALRHAQTTEPIDRRDINDVRKDMAQKLSDAIDEQSNDLEETRTERQRAIDSMAEYERLSQACPGERR